MMIGMRSADWTAGLSDDEHRHILDGTLHLLQYNIYLGWGEGEGGICFSLFWQHNSSHSAKNFLVLT